MVEAEVWLCLRTMLLRFSPQHLSPLWPVIISEMVEHFESLTVQLPQDGSDKLHLIGEVSKFLDQLLTLQTHDFQV